MENKIKKTISVWLIVEDGENKGKIPLQKRSLDNKRFVYICQSTWAGKVEENEEVIDAVKRECEEEMGKEFAEKFDFSALKLFCKNKYKIDNKDWEAHSFSGTVNDELLKLAKLHHEAFSRFIFVTKGDKTYSMSSGKDPQKNIILFDDQQKVLEKIFK